MVTPSIYTVVGGLGFGFGGVMIRLGVMGTSMIWDVMLIRVGYVVFSDMCFFLFLLPGNVVGYSVRVF